MPQFIIRAKDYTDDSTINRRLSVRESHLVRMRAEKRKGVFIIGGALLNDDGKLIGSIIILSLPDKQSVLEWIQQDLYMTERVWNEVEVTPFRVAEV